MKHLFSHPVLNHFAAQVGMGALVALVTYLAGVDYSALGPWAGVAQAVAAVALSWAHKVTGVAVPA